VVLGLITQWLNPLREFLAPSFSPQLESAAPLLALPVQWYGTVPVLGFLDICLASTAVPVVRTTVLAHSGSQ
jgi:hypothetical protein